jgi:fatty acid desaturase/membrane-associated phospholipid phosphatase
MNLYRDKLWLFFALGLWVTVPFFAIQYHPVFPAVVMPVTPIDRFVPLFQPAVWVYLSLYLQITLPLLLARELRELYRMCFGFAWVVVVSHTIFLFWPTAIPPLIPGIPITDPLLRIVDGIETSLSACPSLHASLAIYCGLCAARLLEARTYRVLLWIWTFLILAATLLSKQHVFLDIAAGGALGWIAFVALFRPQPAEAAASEALQATLQARNELAHSLGPHLGMLSSQDQRRRAAELACFAGLAASGVFLTVTGWTAAGIAATALALNAFVLFMHEGMHDSLFRSRRANWFGSVLLGATFLMSFSAYRVLHTRHHHFLGDPRDPDDYRNYTGRRALLWSLHFVRLTCGSLLYLGLIPMLALKYGAHAERRRILGEYALLLVAYSALLRFVPTPLLLVAWGIPLLIVGNLTAIRGFTQHGITDASDPYIASRTILPHPIVEFFVLHENYHLEHHLFPEVPSYHLPRLHRMVWPQLPRVVSGRGYLQFLGRFLRATSRLDETPIGLERPAEKSA